MHSFSKYLIHQVDNEELMLESYEIPDWYEIVHNPEEYETPVKWGNNPRWFSSLGEAKGIVDDLKFLEGVLDICIPKFVISKRTFTETSSDNINYVSVNAQFKVLEWKSSMVYSEFFANVYNRALRETKNSKHWKYAIHRKNGKWKMEDLFPDHKTVFSFGDFTFFSNESDATLARLSLDETEFRQFYDITVLFPFIDKLQS